MIITKIMFSLRRTLSPATEDRRRTENSLKMCVFEVKGLPDKKKYFCEIHVDDKIYARYANSEIQISISNDFELSLFDLLSWTYLIIGVMILKKVICGA